MGAEGPRSVWFHPRPAFPPRGGGEVRLHGLLRGLIAADQAVMLVLPAGGDPTSLDLDLVHVTGHHGARLVLSKVFSSHPLRSPRLPRDERKRVRDLVLEFKPDVAVVSDLLSWPLARHLIPSGLPWVYDASNVESRLYDELRAHATGIVDRLTFSIDARRVARDELRVLGAASGVAAVSLSDAEALRALVPRQHVTVVPSSVDAPESSARGASADGGGLFVGTLDYPPNDRAVHALVNEVWPRVRLRHPRARLTVVGRRPTAHARSLMAGTDWVDFHEDAPSLQPHYDDALCVVLPIYSGGGTRLKVYEALAHGVPIIGTAVALSGVGLEPGRDCIEAEGSEAIAASVSSLLADPAEAARLGAAGRRAFQERLSWEVSGQPNLLALLGRVSTH